MDLFLYDNGLRHERVKAFCIVLIAVRCIWTQLIYLFIIYLFIDKYLYRIKTLQQYIDHKNINFAVITVCPA